MIDGASIENRYHGKLRGQSTTLFPYIYQTSTALYSFGCAPNDVETYAGAFLTISEKTRYEWF